MKTKNLIMLVAFIAIATMTFAQKQTAPTPFAVKISLTNAMQNPQLVLQMQAQLNLMDVLGNEEAVIYFGYITFRGVRFVIYGTYNEWIAFFKLAQGVEVRNL